MQANSRILDDISRTVTGAAGLLGGVRAEVEAAVKQRLESLLADMNLVTREEFEVVRDLAVNARRENELLAARVAALEAALQAQKPPAGDGAPKRSRKARRD